MISRFCWMTPCGMVLLSGIALGVAGMGFGERPQTGPRGWRQHDRTRPKPVEVESGEGTLGLPPPRDAVNLLNDGTLSAWCSREGGPAPWKLAGGVLEVVPGTGAIQTKASFGDIQLHLEWAVPDPPRGVSQDRGNSGVFLMGQFEIQILDSYRSSTYADGYAGAIYGQYPPLSNASRPPGQWQSYDIAFRRPRFDAAGRLLEGARITVLHNGILIQNNEELSGQTNWLEPTPYDPAITTGPIQLQDHSHPVRFRNLWVRELPDRPPPPAPTRPPVPQTLSLSPEALLPFTGAYSAGPEPDALNFSIERGEGSLLLHLPRRPIPVRLEPAGPSRFVMPHTDGELRFRTNDQGEVVEVVIQVGDGERTLARVGD